MTTTTDHHHTAVTHPANLANYHASTTYTTGGMITTTMVPPPCYLHPPLSMVPGPGGGGGGATATSSSSPTPSGGAGVPVTFPSNNTNDFGFYRPSTPTKAYGSSEQPPTTTSGTSSPSYHHNQFYNTSDYGHHSITNETNKQPYTWPSNTTAAFAFKPYVSSPTTPPADRPTAPGGTVPTGGGPSYISYQPRYGASLTPPPPRIVEASFICSPAIRRFPGSPSLGPSGVFQHPNVMTSIQRQLNLMAFRRHVQRVQEELLSIPDEPSDYMRVEVRGSASPTGRKSALKANKPMRHNVSHPVLRDPSGSLQGDPSPPRGMDDSAVDFRNKRHRSSSVTFEGAAQMCVFRQHSDPPVNITAARQDIELKATTEDVSGPAPKLAAASMSWAVDTQYSHGGPSSSMLNNSSMFVGIPVSPRFTGLSQHLQMPTLDSQAGHQMLPSSLSYVPSPNFLDQRSVTPPPAISLPRAYRELTPPASSSSPFQHGLSCHQPVLVAPQKQQTTSVTGDSTQQQQNGTISDASTTASGGTPTVQCFLTEDRSRKAASSSSSSPFGTARHLLSAPATHQRLLSDCSDSHNTTTTLTTYLSHDNGANDVKQQHHQGGSSRNHTRHSNSHTRSRMVVDAERGRKKAAMGGPSVLATAASFSSSTHSVDHHGGAASIQGKGSSRRQNSTSTTKTGMSPAGGSHQHHHHHGSNSKRGSPVISSASHHHQRAASSSVYVPSGGNGGDIMSRLLRFLNR